MSSKPKTPKPRKPARPGKCSAGEHLTVSIDLIFLAPDLAAVPTMGEAAALDTDDDGPAADWNRLCNSIQKHGIIEPLKCVRTPGSSWECYDGRSRLEAAKFEGLKTVPIISITAAQAAEIVTESLKRRHLPAYALTYLECLKHERQLVSAKRGRPSNAIGAGDAVTQRDIADALGAPLHVVNECVAALRHFETHPADREAFEKKILAGLMSPERVIHASTGKAATAGKERNPSSYQSWLPKLKSFTSTLRGFDKWGESGRANAGAALTAEACNWSGVFRVSMMNALHAADEKEAEALAEKTLARTLTKKGGKP